MVIDPVTINTPDIKVRQDLQTNSGQDLSGRANNRTDGDKAAPDDLVTINNTTDRQTGKLSNLQANPKKLPLSPILLGIKGVIALDDDKNPVVRFFDKKGKMVAQYPPEDYLQMMKELHQVAESLFHKKV